MGTRAAGNSRSGRSSPPRRTRTGWLWTAVRGAFLLAALGWLGFGSARAAIALLVLPLAGAGASYLAVSDDRDRQAIGVAGLLLVIAGAGIAIGDGGFDIAAPTLIVCSLFWLALASITFAGSRIPEGARLTGALVGMDALRAAAQ